MKKLICIILLSAVLLCALASCTASDPIIEVSDDNYVVVNGVKTEHKIAQDASDETNYHLANIGTKIENLPLSKQEKIADYVADCKTIFSVNYTASALDYNVLESSYISFTDVFVYDLSKIDESNLDELSLHKLNYIKSLHDGVSKPIMYIELSGFCNSPILDYYRPAYFSDIAIMHGYFIFEDETCVPMDYRQLCTMYYDYKMISGAEFINCGDKFSESKNAEELNYFVEAYQSGLSFEDVLKCLKPISNKK